MGEVVLAHDARIGRNVALKRLRTLTPSSEALARFLREARIQARLEHPAIVPVYDLGRDAEGAPYFTMKRLAGVTLLEKLTAVGHTATTESRQALLRAFVDVCLAADYAHSRGVVHRDLKPSNIMLGDFGEVYVLDWGVARVLGTAAVASDIDTARAPADSELAIGDISPLDSETQAGAVLGTPGYMPPEQLTGDEVKPAADVYALGAILFEILASEPLHPRGTGRDGEHARHAERVARASAGPDREIPPELDAICVAALAADPAARPTARQLADRVQRYLDGDRDVERRRALARDELAARAGRGRERRSGAPRRCGRRRRSRARARSDHEGRGGARQLADARAARCDATRARARARRGRSRPRARRVVRAQARRRDLGCSSCSSRCSLFARRSRAGR